MRGDDKTRFCDTCGKHVHDLSAGTEAEARALFRETERPCVRYTRDASGGVRFKAAALAAAASLAACSAPVAEAPTPSTPAPTTSASAESVEYDMGDAVLDEVDRCPDEPIEGDSDDGCPEPDRSDAGTK
jgi:hypothetical protein